MVQMVDVSERILSATRSMLPTRLLKGAGVLGRLRRAGEICSGGFRRTCPPECQRSQFCAARERWIGLLNEYDPARLGYADAGSTLWLVETMTTRELSETGWTASVEYPERGTLKFGPKGQPWSELVEIGSSPEVWSEAVKIQGVFLT